MSPPVKRRESNRMVFEGERTRSRPKGMWIEAVKQDMLAVNLTRR